MLDFSINQITLVIAIKPPYLASGDRHSKSPHLLNQKYQISG